MSGQPGLRGTGHANLTGLTEGLLIAAAAVETLLLAGLALIASGVDRGSGVVEAFLRLNGLIIRPFALLPFFSASSPGSVLFQQVAAVLGYGAVFLIGSGIVAWFDRRQALY